MINSFFNLIVLSLFVTSCLGSNGEKGIDSLREIATSKYYQAYAESITENLNNLRKGVYDSEEVYDYLGQNFKDANDLCGEDFSESKIKGLSVFIKDKCRITETLRELEENIPAFTSLSDEERVEVHKIYGKEFRDPSSTIYIKEGKKN